MALSKLQDPKGLLPAKKLAELDKKLEQTFMRLAHNPKHGGNPLLYAAASGKPHIVTNNLPTAGTDANKFYWNPKFLDMLSNAHTLAILKHEIYHVLLLHCVDIKKIEMPKVYNIAIDFIVNSMVEREWREKENISLDKTFPADKHPLWNGTLGKPITLPELKKLFTTQKEKILKGVNDSIKDIKSNKKFNGKKLDKTLDEKCVCDEEDNDEEDNIKLEYILVDLSLLGRSSFDIYKELKELYKGLSDELQELFSNLSMDEHIASDQSKKESIEQLLKAIGFAKNLRGTIPNEIESLVEELHDPTLNLSEFLDQITKKYMKDGGTKANYTRFRRRFINYEIYYPRYMRGVPTGLVMLDTSGSMSDQDIASGVSQLKQFSDKADLYIVPVDAKPHWDAISKVSKASDFKRIKIKGRGGTIFEEFFRDYKDKLRHYGRFNFMIVISDGMCDIIPPELAPPCDVGWIITSNTEFQQHFGKPIYLESITYDNT